MRTFTVLFVTAICSLVSVANASAGEEWQLAVPGSFEVVEEDFVYATINGVELQARSYRPKKSGILPAVIDVHGGAWNLYDRTAGEHYNRALASSGLYVLAVDFRQGPEYQHPLGSRDVTSAVRYLRHNAENLKLHGESIGLIGSSSGGHLALLAGLKPNAAIHKPQNGSTGTVKTEELASASAEVDYIIALWPVSDPFYRYQYAKRVGRDGLLAMHEAYFGDEEQMRSASIQRILNEGEAVAELPPVLIVQAGDDGNIPREMTFDLIAAYQEQNGALDYAFYPNVPHAFGHRASPSTDDLIDTMRSFIQRQL